MKIWSLPKHENLTTGKNIVEKRRISLLFHNIFNMPLTSSVQIHKYLLNVVVRIIFSSILQIWYVEVRISRSISESALEFEITRVECIKLATYLVCGSCKRQSFKSTKRRRDVEQTVTRSQWSKLEVSGPTDHCTIKEVSKVIILWVNRHACMLQRSNLSFWKEWQSFTLVRKVRTVSCLPEFIT